MTQKSVKRQLGSMILAFEAFVVFFGTLVAFGLKIAEPQLVWGSSQLSLSVFLVGR